MEECPVCKAQKKVMIEPGGIEFKVGVREGEDLDEEITKEIRKQVKKRGY